MRDGTIVHVVVTHERCYELKIQSEGILKDISCVFLVCGAVELLFLRISSFVGMLLIDSPREDRLNL